MQGRILQAADKLGGAFTRDAVMDRYLADYQAVADRRSVSECLRALERRGKVFANDGNGTLARWGGIRRGGFWSTRRTLSRDYGYGPEELGPERD